MGNVPRATLLDIKMTTIGNNMTKQLRLFIEDSPEKSKKTYNHAFDLAFEVAGSEEEDSYECLKNETEKVIAALKKRVSNIVNRDRSEHLEVFGCIDTFEEE